MYGNATDFYLLILNLSALLKLSALTVLMESLESLMLRIILSANRDNMTSFPICLTFIFFSCLRLEAKIGVERMEKVGTFALFLMLLGIFLVFLHLA